MTLGEFNDWLAEYVWELDDSPDCETTNIVYDIELRLAEYSAGHLSGDELRACLRELVRDP
jgi:hypothetical protein